MREEVRNPSYNVLSPRLSSALDRGLLTPSKSPEWVRFGAFELDCRNGELRRDGTLLKLQPQPAKVLGLLVNRAGEVVTRQELAQQVWGSETFVDFEQGLNFAIRQIRTVLEDDAEHPHFLETLPKRGYRFIAEVDKAVESAAPEESPIAPPNEGEAANKPRWLNWKWAAVAGTCVLLLIGLIFRYRTTKSPAGITSITQIQSIAVLPLANLSSDPNQEYFSDGLTDELITELAKTGNLRVISRTSVIGFKGSRKQMPEIGRELRVDAIVEGTIERVGNRVRIRAQLIHAETDHHIWAESYDRDVSDLLGLERELARDIAQQIGRRSSQRQPVTGKVAASAHEDYLRGRYFWNKRTAAGMGKGIEYFQKAIDQEPNYAAAYAGLADSYIMLANWGLTPPAGAYLKAKAAALKALELDDQLAEAESSLAYVTLLYDWDWEGAEKRFRQAIAINPNYASAHHFYSICLMTRGKQTEAVAEIKRAQELDPLSLIVNDVVGWIYYEGRQYDQAIEQYNKTLEADANYAPALLDLGTAYLRQGNYSNAIAQFEKARAVDGENGVVLSGLAQAHALSGNRDEALKILKRIQRSSAPIFISSWDLSFIYAALGEKKKAVALLRQAADEHVGWIVRLGVDPALDNLRTELHFRELIRRVGIPQRSAT
jgi:TolB-like protein/DNA-binding winged helix-turn-helix (wHTH) protein/Tfp pilus assembly protein PilF